MRSAATMGELRMPNPNLTPRETVIPQTVAPKEKPLRPVTPEAKTEVQNMLSVRKQELEAAQKRLAWNLKQGNCIRLDDLSHDFSGEIQRYQNALDALNQGNSAQARVLLEKQVCHNLLSREDMSKYQQETTTQYSQAGKIMADARGKLTVNPSDKMNLINLDRLDAAVNKIMLRQIYAAHPDWRNSADPQIIALKNAEVVRLKNMLTLTTPEQLLAQATELAKNPQDANRHLELFAQIQYKELQMLEQQRVNMGHIVGAHNRFDSENLQLEAMISKLGGQTSYHPERQARQQQFLQQMMLARETGPVKRYDILMASCQNSPQIAEQRMVWTYRELQKQRLAAESSIQNLEAKLKQADLKPNERTKAERLLRLARLERSRISLVSWRETELYQLFKEKQGQKGKASPSLHQLSAEYQQKEFALNPKEREWVQKGFEWKKLADQEKNIPPGGFEQLQQRVTLVKQKEKIIQEIISGHKAIIEQHWSQAFNLAAPQPYYYLVPKAYNQTERSKLLASVKGVNEAQDSFMQKLQIVGPDAVINLPTAKFRKEFQDVEKIAQERKIHLMPQLTQQPKVLDRLLALMEKQPTLRDQISNIKVRIEGNGNPDGLPEIVIYTSDKQFSQVLNHLMIEFSDMKGTGVVPRFNQEVANGLIYYAQSGGDLKELLRANLGTGVLRKVFDPQRNFAELRV